MFIPDPGSGFFLIPDPDPEAKKALDPGLDPQHCYLHDVVQK
jgi:hypothetical protein